MAGSLQNYTSTLLRNLRLVAILEGISYIVLLGIAMPVKYIGNDDRLVKHTGMVHGWLFVLYVLLVAVAWSRYRWSWQKAGLALFLSLVPFGTFYAERKMFQEPGPGSSSGLEN